MVLPNVWLTVWDVAIASSLLQLTEYYISFLY